MNPSHRWRSDSAFTLIELVTVIAIITILSGLVAPVIVRSKLAGKRTVEINQLRQCGLAASLYVNDHDGVSQLDASSVRLLVASGYLVKEIVNSPLDRSELGMANKLLTDGNRNIDASLLSSYRNSILSFVETGPGTEPDFVAAVVGSEPNDQNNHSGYFATISEFPDDQGGNTLLVPDALGSTNLAYFRLTKDLSVLRRTMPYIPLLPSQPPGAYSSTGLLFFDPSPEWIRRRLSSIQW